MCTVFLSRGLKVIILFFNFQLIVCIIKSSTRSWKLFYLKVHNSSGLMYNIWQFEYLQNKLLQSYWPQSTISAAFPSVWKTHKKYYSFTQEKSPKSKHKLDRIWRPVILSAATCTKGHNSHHDFNNLDFFRQSKNSF